jgi:hypothetical protein
MGYKSDVNITTPPIWQNGSGPPYEAGEHWGHCAIRPEGAIQGLYRHRLAHGCALAAPAQWLQSAAKRLHWGVLSFAYFYFHEQRKVSRREAKQGLSENGNTS